jgi:hypothetical protein
MESTTKNPKNLPTEARDKSVKIRIISKRGNTRERPARERCLSLDWPFTVTQNTLGPRSDG